MSREAYKHHHKYKAVNSNRKMYRCTIVGCPHSMPASTMIGRKAECPECGGDITITEEHLRRTNITCIGCGRSGFTKNLKPPSKVIPGVGSTAAEILGKFAKP